MTYTPSNLSHTFFQFWKKWYFPLIHLLSQTTLLQTEFDSTQSYYYQAIVYLQSGSCTSYPPPSLLLLTIPTPFSSLIGPHHRIVAIMIIKISWWQLWVILFPQCSQGEFVEQSRTSLFGDNILYVHDLSVQCHKWFCEERLDVFNS